MQQPPDGQPPAPSECGQEVDAKSQSGNVAPPRPPGPGHDTCAARSSERADTNVKDAAIDPRDVLRNDPTVAKKLLGYAYKKTRDVARAKDAAQEAVARMLEGKGFYRWDPDAKTLLNHLADIVDTVVANERRRAAGWREEALRPAQHNQTADSDPGPEQMTVNIEDDLRQQRLADEIMMRVQDDPVIPRMLDLVRAGTEEAAEQGRQLRCTVKDIYRARERLAHHRDAVLDREKSPPPSGGAKKKKEGAR
jgi:DNA-directed RNA polymerase specialized sigma24 family protein